MRFVRLPRRQRLRNRVEALVLRQLVKAGGQRCRRFPRPRHFFAVSQWVVLAQVIRLRGRIEKQRPARVDHELESRTGNVVHHGLAVDGQQQRRLLRDDDFRRLRAETRRRRLVEHVVGQVRKDQFGGHDDLLARRHVLHRVDLGLRHVAGEHDVVDFDLRDRDGLFVHVDVGVAAERQRPVVLGLAVLRLHFDRAPRFDALEVRPTAELGAYNTIGVAVGFAPLRERELRRIARLHQRQVVVIDIPRHRRLLRGIGRRNLIGRTRRSRFRRSGDAEERAPPIRRPAPARCEADSSSPPKTNCEISPSERSFPDGVPVCNARHLVRAVRGRLSDAPTTR